MAALDFPASPSNGATYTGPGGVVWTWDGSKWVTQGIATAYLPLAGGTMTGVLGAISGGPPTASINFGGTANTGLYGNANLVGIMSGGQARFTVDGTTAASQGPLLLPGPPTTALQAATKGYVDGFLPLAGGTLTGPLVLAGPPTLALHPATMAYVDAKFPVSVANGGTGATTGNAGPYLPLAAGSGNGLTGPLIAGQKSNRIGGNGGSDGSGAVTQADANILLYDAGGSNWAGIGADATGNMWLYTRASTTPGLFMPVSGQIRMPLSGGVHIGDNNVFTPSSARFTVVSNTGVAAQIANWASGGTSLLVAVSQTATTLVNFHYWNGSTLAVVGTISTSGTNVAYNTSSDARLKTDIQPLTDSGMILDQLHPVSFHWQAQPDDPPSHGFIAQDMYRVYPQPVTPGNELEPGEEGFRPWGMDHSMLVPLLTAEIKSLRQRVAALEGVPA